MTKPSTRNRQCVGPMRRTLVLDIRFATHDHMALQQFYRNNALAPVLLTQAFAFYDTVGILVVFVQAGLEAGHWYWARLGFEFFRSTERAAVARCMGRQDRPAAAPVQAPPAEPSPAGTLTSGRW